MPLIRGAIADKLCVVHGVGVHKISLQIWLGLRGIGYLNLNPFIFIQGLQIPNNTD